jgi:serine protease Do
MSWKNKLRKGSRMKYIKLSIVVFAVAVLIIELPAFFKDPRVDRVVEIVYKASPSVVNISTEKVVPLEGNTRWGDNYGAFFDRFSGEFFNRHQEGGKIKYNSIGSGVVLSEDGVIVTNAHVVNKASKIFVTTSEGNVFIAHPVKTDRTSDLALIKVNSIYRFKPVNIKKDDKGYPGEKVIAIGNPFGLENSVSTGVISGFKRSFRSRNCNYACTDLIQTDASINPGSSGGGLFNMKGELTGINVAMVQDSDNIGFAIPMLKVRRLLEQNTSAIEDVTAKGPDRALRMVRPEESKK